MFAREYLGILKLINLMNIKSDVHSLFEYLEFLKILVTDKEIAGLQSRDVGHYSRIVPNSTIRMCCFYIIFINYYAKLAPNLMQICPKKKQKNA